MDVDLSPDFEPRDELLFTVDEVDEEDDDEEEEEMESGFSLAAERDALEERVDMMLLKRRAENK